MKKNIIIIFPLIVYKMERKIFKIFAEHPRFKGRAYLKFLYQELVRKIKAGTYIYYEDSGTWIDWNVYKRKPDRVLINRIITKTPGKGFGTKILQEVLDKYPGYEITLKVENDNTLAINFYIKNGFKYKEKSRENFSVYKYMGKNKKLPTYTHTPVSVVETKRIGSKGIRTIKHQEKKSSRTEYSPYPMEVGEMCAEFFCRDAALVVDPFAGWGERNVCCTKFNKPYIGYDISPEAIEYAKKKYNVINYLADSRTEPIPPHDALITCPPYWNLEKYKGDNNLSRIKNWNDFLDDYELILSRCAEEALPDSTYCFMVGDWRMNKEYYNLSYETERIMLKLGFKTFDKVIINQKPITPYLKMMHNAKRFGYTAKVHQYLLVFKR